jgi:hypothetical protein
MTPKLTPADVVAIREAVAAGQSRLELAAHYDVHRSHIDRLVRGENWRSAGGPITGHGWPRTNTGYWGVSANGAGNRFYASIVINSNRRTLGSHRDPETAARRYDAAARAAGFPADRINFPEE